MRPRTHDIDRDDPQEAARIFRELLPDLVSRRFVAEVLAASITTAHDAQPASWSLTLFSTMVRLNVGQVEVATLRRDNLHLIVSTADAAEDPMLAALDPRGPVYPAVPVPSGVVNLAPEQMAAPRVAMLHAHRAFVQLAANHKRGSPFRRAYSHGAILFLEAFLARALPRPSYFVDDAPPASISEEVLDAGALWEGATRTILVNAYERDARARRACLAHFGFRCAVCGLSFEERYGAEFARVIHVHHIVPLSAIREEYQVDAVNDLRPVCPNCHAVLHSTTPPMTIDEVRVKLRVGHSA